MKTPKIITWEFVKPNIPCGALKKQENKEIRAHSMDAHLGKNWLNCSHPLIVCFLSRCHQQLKTFRDAKQKEYKDEGNN